MNKPKKARPWVHKSTQELIDLQYNARTDPDVRAAVEREIAKREKRHSEAKIERYAHLDSQGLAIRRDKIATLLQGEQAENPAKVRELGVELKALNREMARRATNAGLKAKAAPVQIPAPEGHIPQWQEGKRGAPRALIRGGLFRPGNPNAKRRNFRQELIATWGNSEVRYTGEELFQDDLDVWLEILHAARKSPLDTYVELPAAELMQQRLGWSRTNASKTRLASVLTRLTATALLLRVGDVEVRTQLIGESIYDARRETVRVKLTASIRELFVTAAGDHAYTRLTNITLLGLSPMQSWLYRFYASQQLPFRPVKVETLFELSRSLGSIENFRETLRLAVRELLARDLIRATLEHGKLDVQGVK